MKNTSKIFIALFTLGLLTTGYSQTEIKLSDKQMYFDIDAFNFNDGSIITGDEPTGNLDSKNSDIVFDIFKELSVEEKLSLLVVTHDGDFAKRTDRIIEMEDGKIIN